MTLTALAGGSKSERADCFEEQGASQCELREREEIEVASHCILELCTPSGELRCGGRVQSVISSLSQLDLVSLPSGLLLFLSHTSSTSTVTKEIDSTSQGVCIVKVWKQREIKSPNDFNSSPFSLQLRSFLRYTRQPTKTPISKYSPFLASNEQLTEQDLGFNQRFRRRSVRELARECVLIATPLKVSSRPIQKPHQSTELKTHLFELPLQLILGRLKRRISLRTMNDVLLLKRTHQPLSLRMYLATRYSPRGRE